MRSVYSFILGVPGKLGVGTADRGFTRSHSLAIDNVEGPGISVRRSMGPTAPGYVKLQQQLVPASMLGDSGLGLAGSTILARLAERG